MMAHNFEQVADRIRVAAPQGLATRTPALEIGKRIHQSRHADTHYAKLHDTPVVVKRVRFDIDADARRERARHAIQAEGELLRRLSHPNIVRIVELVPASSMMVLELVPGRTIREEMRERRRLPAAEVASIGMQLANALAYLHSKRILHRDVKPANVMYDGYRAVLIDFHLAKPPGRMRGGAGTRLFAPPEQVNGGRVTPTADMWGLGTILYRALTGRLPFHADKGHPQLKHDVIPTLARFAEARYDGDLERAAQHLPPEFARIVDRLLRRDPALRPTATELIALLAPFTRPRA